MLLGNYENIGIWHRYPVLFAYLFFFSIAIWPVHGRESDVPGKLHPSLQQQRGVDKAKRTGGESVKETNSPLFRRRNFPLSFPERGPVQGEQ
jgi:hypothetical protein